MGNTGQSDASGQDTHNCDWNSCADCLAKLLPVETLHPRAIAELRKLTPNGSRPIGIACSGGADSLGLLLLLFAHFPELRTRFAVLHFDHRIRGTESSKDAEFVCNVSNSLGLCCESASWDAGSPDATEEAAREARMTFLHEHADVIAFGHNMTDVAETMLLRLGRGSSLDGLAGPRPVQRFRNKPVVLHLRPLLSISGTEIREKLRACGIPWREDSTNAGTKYTRNKLRHEVLPVLEAALGRDWAAGAARSRERIEEADEALNTEADGLLRASHENDEALHISVIANTNAAVARRILERWLENNEIRVNIPVQAIDRILEAAKNGTFPKNLNISGLSISNEYISETAHNSPPVEWSEIGAAHDCEIFLPNGSSLRIQSIDLTKDQIPQTIADLRSKGSLTDIMIAADLDTRLTIRRREGGDAYKPLGATGRSKLHDMQINRKIPVSERMVMPVVLEESHIVWSPLLPPAEESKLTETTTHAVRLTYRNISPVSDSY